MYRMDHRLLTHSARHVSGERASGSQPSRRLRPRVRKTWWAASVGVMALIFGLILISTLDHLWTPSEHIVLSLQGSTSLGDELMPKLAAAFLRDDMGAEETGFKVVGRDAKGHAHLHIWGKVPGRTGLQVIEIYATGSGAAFECLAADSGASSCDIGMSSRPINDSDKASYPPLQDLGERGNEHVVA